MELFVSDLDGTLLTSQKVLSKQTILILNRLLEQGLQLTVATARSLVSASNMIAPLNLSLPIVLFNGVFVYDPLKHKYLVSQFLTESVVNEMLEFLSDHHIQPWVYTQDFQGVQHVYYTGIQNHSEKRYISDRLDSGDKRFRKVSSFKEALSEQVICINAIHSKNVLDPIFEEVKKTFSVNSHYAEDIYAPGYYWLEMTHPHATKRHGVEFLKTHLGVTRLICFGDHLNDLPMFDLADKAYAVANAHHAVKQMATGIISSNNCDGVAHFLAERMCLSSWK